MTARAKISPDYVVLGCVLLLNIAVWYHTSPLLPKWANVPPAPSEASAAISFLGDKELAYRSLSITIQSFGNNTGQVMALKDYNYPNLGTWFALADSLDQKSNYVPFLAAYYFGGSQDPSELMPVINYLRRVGTYSGDEKYRYLGQAVFLARHKMKNMPLAMDLAKELAGTYKKGMPGWVAQMPAIIASGMGEQEMAYSLMLDTLQHKSAGMDPAEINYMLDEICNNILTPAQKSSDLICIGQ